MKTKTAYISAFMLDAVKNLMPHALILLILLASLMACDAEDNPTNMKGRTITSARLPKIQPMTLPKIPAGVREQLAGTNGRRRSPAPATISTQPSTQGEPEHAHQTTPHHSRDGA